MSLSAFVITFGCDFHDLSVPDPSITGAIRNRLWNTRNTCGIFIREYRFAARMSVQRSPVIALVCFPERHRRLNVANTGKPSRRTYRSLYGIHTLCSHGNLCKSDTIVGSTTRETRRQIGCNLLLTKSAMHSTEVRINCSFFSPPFSLLQAHVVECTVEMLFALKKMRVTARTVHVSIKKR